MKKRMAQVTDGRTMSVGEILGGAAQDSKWRYYNIASDIGNGNRKGRGG
jgi:hypothetical protein